VAALVVLVLVAGGWLLAGRDSTADAVGRGEAGAIATGIVEGAIEDLRSAPATSAVVYQQILPSLVRIETGGRGGDGPAGGFGSGVIVNGQGAVLTALHVVEGASEIRLSFAGGGRSEGYLVSQDPENDIAVVLPAQPPEPIVPAVLGGGGQVGDETYAVGHPLGYVGSLSSGVVSGLDRTVEIRDGQLLKGLIQFDAAVNPGSSGGPLLNRAGQVIGIVTALANPSDDGFFRGIGFAVPIGTAGGAADAPPK
jgi:S1-C subfamily serine protease